MLKNVVAALALILGFSTVMVADDAPRRDPKAGVDVTRTQKAGQNLAHRASKIIGMTVQNDAGKELGTINDIVLDVQGGQIRYAAVSYGGFLGLGDKLFAVPWQAFDVRKTPDAETYHLVLKNVTEAELKNAPGFNQNAWPDFGDQQYQDDLNKAYKVKINAPGVDVKVNR